jgi:putative CocE/NonD family hydrolase
MLREDARRMGLRAASDKLEAAWSTIRAQATQTPYSEHPAIVDPALPSYVRDWISHRESGPYWQSLDISMRLDRIQIPALHIAGWFDTYLEGSIAAYRALSLKAGSEFARDNQYLLAGPWVHIPWGDRAGEANFGSEANLNTDELLLRWFNHWLKDSGEFAAEPRVRHFVLGPNEWRNADAWPTAADVPLYLRSAGNANSRRGDGSLASTPSSTPEPHDVFVYDPDVPVPAPGGPQSMSGPFDQAVLEMGNNLLVYTSAPAPHEIAIFGQPRMELYAATSAANADFTAKIVRVTASGRAEFISIGIARSSTLFRASTYASDKIHAWTFTLEPTSFVLGPGERLRLEIASSGFPLYDRNPSTSVSPQNADPWNWGRSTQQIVHTPQHPSALYLPITGGAAW